LSKDLPIKRLGELAVVKKGLSSYYLRKGGVNVPVINVKDVQSGKVNAKTVDRVFVRKTDHLKESQISLGDVIVTIKGHSFRVAVADESVADFVISANLAALTPSSEIKPEIIAAYLNSSKGQRELLARAGGSGMIKGLNIKSLLEVPIPIPSQEEQETLSRFLTLAQEHEDLLRRELDLRNKIKETIIAQVME